MLENSSSVASTKENLAEAAAKEEKKAEAVPNTQKVGRAAGHGVGVPIPGGFGGLWVVGVHAEGLWHLLEAPLTSPFCFLQSPLGTVKGR